MSKSLRTQYRHAKSFKTQTKLTGFGYKAPYYPTKIQPKKTQPKVFASAPIADDVDEVIETPSALPRDVNLPAEGSSKASRARSASVLSDPSTDNDHIGVLALTDVGEEADQGDTDSDSELVQDDQAELADVNSGSMMAEKSDDDVEDDEDELMEGVQGPKGHIRDWIDLRKDIKALLKKNSKILPLSQLNQYLIISNFATLHIKGLSCTHASLEIARQWHEGQGNWFARRVRALARHFQIFERLPIEKRGGAANSRSWLHDEWVQLQTRDWLTSQKTGDVTPRKLCRAVNEIIFPELGITPKNPIGEQTARRWLIKLGWRRTQVRRGVYMDGHEREDVVEYRNKIFLPKLAEYEKLMAEHILDEATGNLTKIVPELEEGQLCIIAQFHDESCFHANDEARNLWLQAGEQPLRKKSRGRLIHVSDFVNEEDGQLVLLDKNGQIVCDARKIIHPGSHGDPWWDNDQLMDQMKSAIEIFEAAHPNCQALFIFDQSSAHASLPANALKAFEMNKSNGGKQRLQRDTIIPDTNPDAQCRGQCQSMTTASGEAKGLQQTLEERGFNVSKLRAKCSPVCPFESTNCCMAQLLSQQDDFVNQESMLESFIKAEGHLCLFLPKFHCELNPIEMVSIIIVQNLFYW